MIRLNQNLGLRMLRETLIEARASREVVFREIVEPSWRAKGKSPEMMTNYFELGTRQACEYVDEAIQKIKKEERDRRSV